MKNIIYSIALFLFVLASCTQPPDYPIEPVITFNRLSQDFMQQGLDSRDTVIMTFDFTDGDGDLGNEDDSLDIFISDTRLDADPLTYKLPFVPLQGTGNGISGEISVFLPSSCCIYPNNVAPPCDTTVTDLYPTDTLIYEVFIKDRAGNESNRILSDEIILFCN